ncbi:transposase, partial [Acinetobacter baumannii]
WSDFPLCSRYRLVQFVEQQVGIRAGSRWHDGLLTWALGALGEGRPDPLGVWQHSVEGGLDWQAVFGDLVARGVERIDYAVNADARA